jgi:hypothetical protein
MWPLCGCLDCVDCAEDSLGRYLFMLLGSHHGRVACLMMWPLCACLHCVDCAGDSLGRYLFMLLGSHHGSVVNVEVVHFHLYLLSWNNDLQGHIHTY